MNIAEVDKNLSVSTKIDKSDICFYNARKAPFKVYGIFHDDGKFRRLPEAVAKSVNDGVHALHANTAGGRVRFKTNSPYVAVYVKYGSVGKMPHFAFTASIGLDLYVKQNGVEVYYKTFVPPVDIADTLESVIDFVSSEEREITINMPLYSEVKEIYIGLSETASVSEHTPYKTELPIVYYGSSITQGGCASRPGTCYTGIVARRLDCNHINLGFSGNAKGEKEISDYIKKLDMSAFVYDYDHNAPNAGHLEKTHERMFLEIREAKPDLPIVMLTAPMLRRTEDFEKRLHIIEKTYENALARGDKKVSFIPGYELMKGTDNDATVDDCHPTDLGFRTMADAVTPVIEGFLYKNCGKS